MSSYEWDDAKAATNLRVHGVTFEEAKTVPDDPLRWILPDRDHSWDEARLVVIGHSKEGSLLVVVTSDRDIRPRLISARRATKRERHAYETRP